MRVSFPRMPEYSPCWFKGKLTHGILKQDFKFSVEINGEISHYTISKGFIWNGNNIPKFAWLLTGTPWEMDLLLAGLVHDWFYGNQKLSREIADKLHYLLCRKCGVSWWRAQKMHKALRVAGWKAWNNHKNKITEEK